MNCSSLQIVLNKDDLVQVVTETALERIGRVEFINEEFITIVPHNNEELLKLIVPDDKERALMVEYKPSISWEIIIPIKNIKEIIVLKRNGEKNIIVKSKTTKLGSDTSNESNF